VTGARSRSITQVGGSSRATMRLGLAVAAAFLLSVGGPVGARPLTGNSHFSDPAGDLGSADGHSTRGVDIRDVDVSNDDTGRLRFRVDTNAACTRPDGNSALPCPGQSLAIGIDSDRNAATGDNAGFEYQLAWDEGGAALRMFGAAGYTEVGESARARRLRGGTASELSLSVVELAPRPRRFDFAIASGDVTGAHRTTDTAPDSGRWTYLVRIAPMVHVFPATVRRGTPAVIRYQVADDSNRATAVFTVSRNHRLATDAFSSTLHDAYLGGEYRVRWRVPKGLARGRYTMCLAAFDSDRNRSRRSCAPLRVV
jgi:hypothetical protein